MLPLVDILEPIDYVIYGLLLRASAAKKVKGAESAALARPFERNAQNDLRGKADEMNSKKRNALLVGAGFLLGTAGVKALTSTAAKKCYVQGVAKGLQAKAAYENIVEQAKAQVDDIVAEANYINLTQSEAAAEKVEKAEGGADPEK